MPQPSSFLFCFLLTTVIKRDFPSISFRASLALCISLKSRWLMLFLILFQSGHTVKIIETLIHCQMKVMEELLLSSISINTLIFLKKSEIHNVPLKWFFISLSPQLYFCVTENNSTK